MNLVPLEKSIEKRSDGPGGQNVYKRITILGEPALFVDTERSQLDNKAIAFHRLEWLIPKQRNTTGPTKASREQWLLHKKLASLKKARRIFYQPKA